MTPTVELGPFEVGELLGEGGMARVYRARHRQTAMEVAVKVIGGERADDHARELFRREVQAHAGLLHPHIVHLFEYGRVGAAARDGANGEFVAGSPFVAMELAERGSLRDLLPLHDWTAVRRVLVQALDGLAFSHSRGVIHRDLKPENFLVFEASGAQPFSIKLADFGIAHALEGARTRDVTALDSTSGTPAYMPPEQIRGQWRHYGPWTDIYALGCMAWEMVCGRRPFRAANAMALFVEHTRVGRPALEPRFEVPNGLQAWVHRAMAIDPAQRFRTAADAARALPTANSTGVCGPANAPARPAGGEASSAATTQQVDTIGLGDTIDFDETSALADVAYATTVPAHEPSPPRAGDAAAPPPDHLTEMDGRTPIPEDWRTGGRSELPLPEIGTGLGLFGLREAPYVDRDRPRDRLWAALRQAQREQQPKIVLVVGEAGAGKSRLVEWMAARAHQLGVAAVLRAVHTPGGEGPAEGLPGMVRRSLQAWNLERSAFYDFLQGELPALGCAASFTEGDARALTELVYPTDYGAEHVDGPRFRFASARAKHALVARFVRRFQGGRTSILWLDDAQWGMQALGLVEHLADATEALASLVILTLREGVLAEQPALRERIERLQAGESCTRVDLAPLGRRDHREFVDRLLPLEAHLGELLVERTEGNPLFSLQLLGDWVERGLLASTPRGFELAEGVQAEVPDTIHELWMGSLDRLVHTGEGEEAGSRLRAIEMAAALGREVDTSEWAQVCALVGVDRADELRDQMVERRLARRADDGWTFAHGLLVDSIERAAREAGRWREHNRQCEALLARLYPNQPGEAVLRRARHLIEAGRFEQALDLLTEDREGTVNNADIVVLQQVHTLREELLDRLGAEIDDPRRIENDIFGVECDLLRGCAADAVLERAISLRRRSRAIADHVLMSRSARRLAACYLQTGDVDKFCEAGHEAVEQARIAGDALELAKSFHVHGFMLTVAGQLERANALLREAGERYRAAGDLYFELATVQARARVAAARGNHARAETMFRRVLDEGREQGFRQLEAHSNKGLGELTLFGGDLDHSRAYFSRYEELSREAGFLMSVAHARLDLALVELKAGRFDAAAAYLSVAEAMFAEQGADNTRYTRHLAHLVRAAGQRDWPSFDRRLDTLDEAWIAQAPLDAGHLWLLELAVEHVQAAHESQRAERLRRRASQLRDRLDDGALD